MTDEELINFLQVSTSASFNKIVAARIEQLVATCETLTAERDAAVEALRAIQTYLQEPAPEKKVSDLKGDLRWIANRARATLAKIKGETK